MEHRASFNAERPAVISYRPSPGLREVFFDRFFSSQGFEIEVSAWVGRFTDELMGVLVLYTVTAVAEIVGCYCVFAWLRMGRSAFLLLPAVLALAALAWLLTLHPVASGRVYAAYGGIYIAASIAWLWLVDGVRPDRWDAIGAGLCLLGAAVIYFPARN